MQHFFAYFCFCPMAVAGAPGKTYREVKNEEGCKKIVKNLFKKFFETIFFRKIKSETKSETMLVQYIKGYPDSSMYGKNKGRITFD